MSASQVNSFTNKKLLKFVITLADGAKFSSGTDNITLQGYRAIADIENAGGWQASTLHARIYGMSQSDMLAARSLSWTATSYVGNSITVTAIDGDRETLVFSGNIVDSWGVYTDAPNVYFQIYANQLYSIAQTPAQARSFPGPTQVADIVTILAKACGLNFTNSDNVQRVIVDEYLKGSNRDQLFTLAKHANIGIYVTSTSVAITDSPTTSINMEAVPVVSKDSGLISYPTLERFGVIFQTLFNPLIVFGGKVTLESTSDTDKPIVSGTWHVSNVHHILSSLNPEASWKSEIRGYRLGIGTK